ncbi:MAG: hypothetical protein HY886_09215 [Deltaproteobacteria bacterium]|nr:hypothetical protein [Deltaproteobacteria bacterium]
MKKWLAIVLILALMATAAPVSSFAQAERPEPSATEITFDVLVIRPLGIAATVVGAGLFIVTLPFALPTGGVGLSARKLVADPFTFTFLRPVGYHE